MRGTWFADEKHRSFELEGHQGGALLLHGFMGTPSEMRPLASVFHQQGFHVSGPLLPGFGERISMIDQVSRSNWIEEAESAWSTLHGMGMGDVLVGFSMGGSIAMHLAVKLPPRKLVLLAPLWKVMGGDWRLKLLPVLKHFYRRVRPFTHADFNDPGIRQFFNGAFSEIDLDNPDVQKSIRDEVSISTSTIDELRRLAESAGDLADRIDVETLVVQGTQDETVRAVDTRQLVSRMGTTARLVELDADHLIVSEDRPAWPEVRDLVLEFTGAGRP